jgi:hypothetical protein
MPNTSYQHHAVNKTLLYAISVVLILSGAGLAFSTIRQIWPRRSETVARQPEDAKYEREPVSIKIPALSINAPVTRLGLEQDGSLQVPAEDDKVGWYAGGAVPGEDGTAIMVGHLDSTIGPAVFQRLKNLKPRDIISISRADGSTVEFKVSRLATYNYDDFPDTEVYGATSYPSLRLLTCAGKYNPRTRHYSQNLVVYAE